MDRAAIQKKVQGKKRVYHCEYFGTMYALPVTMRDIIKSQKLAANNSCDNKDLASAIYLIIEKATDKNGKKLFELDDFLSLLNDVPFDVVGYLTEFVMGNIGAIEDAEKK